MTRFILKGCGLVELPLLTKEELYTVLRGAVEEVKGHLRYLCLSTYGEQFPKGPLYSPLLNADTKCICAKVTGIPLWQEHLVVTRNGVVFLLEFWQEEPPTIQPIDVLLTLESRRGQSCQLWWTRVVLGLMYDLCQKLCNHAHGLRNRAEDTDRMAYTLSGIRDRIEQFPYSRS